MTWTATIQYDKVTKSFRFETLISATSFIWSTLGCELTIRKTLKLSQFNLFHTFRTMFFIDGFELLFMSASFKPCGSYFHRLKVIVEVNEVDTISFNIQFLILCIYAVFYYRAYCVDPWGNPIESFQLDSSDPGFNYMNCRKAFSPLSPIKRIASNKWLPLFVGCARSRFWLSEETIASPSCCTNGSFRLIQCRNGFCYCVNPETGDQVGLETRQSNIESLSCYGQYEPRC